MTKAFTNDPPSTGRRIWFCSLIALTLLFGLSASTAGAKEFTRTLKKKTSIKKLAERFYGRSDYARFITAASKLKPYGPRKAKPGVTLNIPTTWTYRLRSDDTWKNLGRDYLGNPRRGAILAKKNYKNPGKRPPAGHLITIPFHVPYLASKTTPFRRVANLFAKGLSRSQSRELVDLIKQYNFSKSSRVKKGETILVPVFHVSVRRSLLATEGPRPDPGSQRRAAAAARTMKHHLQRGRYARAIAKAIDGVVEARGAPEEVARIFLYLCTAYVAMDEKELAKLAAQKALVLFPEIHLPPQTVSPKVRAVFKTLREASQKGSKQ